MTPPYFGSSNYLSNPTFAFSEEVISETGDKQRVPQGWMVDAYSPTLDLSLKLPIDFDEAGLTISIIPAELEITLSQKLNLNPGKYGVRLWGSSILQPPITDEVQLTYTLTQTKAWQRLGHSLPFAYTDAPEPRFFEVQEGPVNIVITFTVHVTVPRYDGTLFLHKVEVYSAVPEATPDLIVTPEAPVMQIDVEPTPALPAPLPPTDTYLEERVGLTIDATPDEAMDLLAYLKVLRLRNLRQGK